MELLEINYGGGVSNKALIFPAKNKNCKNLYIVLPAMGVRASYYSVFAEELTVLGTVITVDWRGHGYSSEIPSWKNDFGYETLVNDVGVVLSCSKDKFPKLEIILVGHSLGGQISSLFVSRFPNHCNKLILIASGSIYYKGWNKGDALKLKVAGITFGFISDLIGYFPGNLIGFARREAKTLIKDWSRNVMTGKYKLINSDFDYDAAMKSAKPKILALSFEADHLASQKSVDNLLNKFSASCEKIGYHLVGEDVGIFDLNHFNWVKSPKGIIKIIIEWNDSL